MKYKSSLTPVNLFKPNLILILSLYAHISKDCSPPYEVATTAKVVPNIAEKLLAGR
jgi:hypothetical protein